MKVVFTGSSGYIGSQVFKQALADKRIDKIVNLVRRLPTNSSVQHDKVRTIIVKDFNNYDKETITEIEDADAAIWCAGTFTGDQVVHVEYPTTFYNVVTSRPAFKTRTTPFRFVYLGGAFTEPDQSKTLWFMPTARKGSGRGQTAVADFSRMANFEGYVVKPGIALRAYDEASWLARAFGWLAGSYWTAWNDEVAKVMIDVASGGHRDVLISSREIAETAKSRSD
ncbi:uncharacterized protein AB675_2371 [Cyphellophora attinorum]|uniref:NAD(P)-binding domain-containing protein n=1 Tax=Cyphellophora attinorum TaxID=1664694 RepID=A0A0N0NRL8_9EURO|nr:uncharacterized protein AB675_2371 [Phialophora attinorum]KPI45241.1 hypothetical protein AB675_2371 [Phialophora attinorum]